MKRFFLMALSTTMLTLAVQKALDSDARSAVEPSPAVVTIDYLSNLYGPVSFAHRLHADYAACSECHHHTTGCRPSRPSCIPCHTNPGKTESLACAGCHPHSRDHGRTRPDKTSGAPYHIDIPGLQGAYHLLCIDCHEVIGTGPERCEDCHTMTSNGEKFFRIDRADERKTQSLGGGRKETK